MHEAGVSLKLTQEILAHASKRTTRAIYPHSMRRTHDDSADKIAIPAGLAPASMTFREQTGDRWLRRASKKGSPQPWQAAGSIQNIGQSKYWRPCGPLPSSTTSGHMLAYRPPPSAGQPNLHSAGPWYCARMKVRIRHKSSSVAMAPPMAGIGATTFSRPVRI